MHGHSNINVNMQCIHEYSDAEMLYTTGSRMFNGLTCNVLTIKIMNFYFYVLKRTLFQAAWRVHNYSVFTVIFSCSVYAASNQLSTINKADVLAHATKSCREVEEYVHSFLTSALDGVD